MTKKSESRLKRDALAKTMQAEGVVSPYIELENMYNTQRAMFAPYYNMAKLISMPEVSMYLKDIAHTTNLVRGLAADANDLFQRMEATHVQHAGKTALPSAIDENENWAIIQLFQEYQAYYGVHTQTILPIMLELDEHLRYALDQKRTAEAAAIAAATAAHAADQAMAQARADGQETVVINGMTVRADGQGHTAANYSAPAATESAAPSMDGYETAAAPN
jgi:hypothetical protein